MHICTVTIHRVNDFFILFFSSPLSTSDSPHSLFLISFLTLFSLINSLSKMISLFDPTIRLASLIKYNGDSDRPWFRSASLISDHMKTTNCLGRPWSDDPRPWLSECRWFRQVCSIWLLMVAGCGWFWVCVGSVARRRRRWLAGCGWFYWSIGVGDFVEVWVWVWLDGFCWRILLKGGWLGVGMARWRRRVCEFVPEERK